MTTINICIVPLAAAELVLGVKSWGEQPVPVFVLQQVCQGLGSISA